MKIQFYTIIRVEQDGKGEILNIQTLGSNDEQQRARNQLIEIAKTDAEEYGMHFEKFGLSAAIYEKEGSLLPVFTYSVVIMNPKIEIT